MRQAVANQPLTVYGDGSQTRSFCYVDDLIRGLYLLATSGEHLPVNLGNPSEFTVKELADTVIRVTGSSSEIVYEALPIDDPQVRQPDITRAKQVLGWSPTVELEEGLRRMLDTNRTVRNASRRVSNRPRVVLAAFAVALSACPRQVPRAGCSWACSTRRRSTTTRATSSR